MSYRKQLLSVMAMTFAVSGIVRADDKLPAIKLVKWEQGVSIMPRDPALKDMYVSLWFYEWTMFDAVNTGQHTNGVWDNIVTVNEQGTEGTIECRQGFVLRFKATDDGAAIELTATNRSEHDWPKLASIIPCFNPGPFPNQNKQFVNTKTYFPSSDGLAPLYMTAPREIHFNAELRGEIDAEARDGQYVWSSKWPTSDVDSTGGLIVRESNDGQWAAGIAWERFLSCQGHNPWNCMHLSVHVGPLARGESRTIRGRMYLIRGNKDDISDRFEHEFAGAEDK